MTLIEGIGDEVTHFFIGLLVVLIVSFAWWTTSISEQRHVQTVWLLDRRRHRAHRRLTNHTHAVTITEGTATSTPPESPSVETQPTIKPPEASPSSSEERSEDDERTRIVETMDADTCVLRQRRLAFYNRNDSSAASSTCIMEHNYAEAASGEIVLPVEHQENSIRIRLKYINDELKLVHGKPREQLGDFKKRHFESEIRTDKLVRLIFNGQVLQQDTKTLEGCGLYDNCVVHCLVHQRRSVQDGESSESRLQQSNNQNRNTNQNNINQGREWDLGNILLAIICFTLASAWYFRYVYAHLYTVSATVGLILMTGLFTIITLAFYFPDHEHIPQRVEVVNAAQS